MNAMSEKENKNNPWLGLESYQENQIIYGRNEEIADLSQRVLNDVDTVLYGKSGIGKTSIVNAGVLPIARQHGYVPVVIRLDHSNKTPYVRQISAAIARVVEIKEVVPAKNPAQPLLWEVLHCNEFHSGGRRSRVLLIFDQFEEIFTLQSDLSAASAFFAELGDVLNDIMPKGLADEPSAPSVAAAPSADSATPQTVEGFASMSYIFADVAANGRSVAPARYVDDNDIHFIFALREDFLSDFEYFTAKIPSLRHHRFGLRPLNEEQAADIVFGAAVLLLLVGGYFGFDYVYNEKVYYDYFASYETVKGWPVGVGEELTSDERAKDFNATLRSVKRIHFSASENDSLLSLEEYFGEDNTSLMPTSTP